MVWDMRCNKRFGYHKPVNTIHNCHTISSTVSGTPPRIRRRGRRPSSVVKPVSSNNIHDYKNECCSLTFNSFRIHNKV